jgi:hypothetical protein
MAKWGNGPGWTIDQAMQVLADLSHVAGGFSIRRYKWRPPLYE